MRLAQYAFLLLLYYSLFFFRARALNLTRIHCTIEWNSLSLDAWEDRFSRIRRTNLLQSYDYAYAVCPLKRQRARWGLIRIDGAEAGLVQILEAGILHHLIHAIQLDRGPLWFESYGSAEHQAAFFSVFAALFPARWMRRRRVLPEISDDPDFQETFRKLGYRRAHTPGYETIWVDITPAETILRAHLKGKWRNRLVAAEKAGFDIRWDWTGKELPFLLRQHEKSMTEKNFLGPSASFLMVLAKRFLTRRKMLIGTAYLGEERTGIVLFFLHGCGATYQIGWASDVGRKQAAHNILLWQACLILQKEGIQDIDLGGVNDDGAAGVKLFKEGLGGDLVRYIGQYQ